MEIVKRGVKAIDDWMRQHPDASAKRDVSGAELRQIALRGANLSRADLTRIYDKLLLILSPDSIKSEWVNTEIAKALKREIEQKRKMLFPVRLTGFETLKEWECFDADTGKDSAREIRDITFLILVNGKSIRTLTKLNLQSS